MSWADYLEGAISPSVVIRHRRVCFFFALQRTVFLRAVLFFCGNDAFVLFTISILKACFEISHVFLKM